MIFAFGNDTTDYYILPFLALWTRGLDAAWPGPIILLAGTADFSITPRPHHTSHNPYIVPPSWKWMHSWIHTFLSYLNVCHLSAFVELMAKMTRLHEDSIIIIISKSWSRGHGYFIFHNNHDAAAVNWSSYFNREASVTRGLYSCWRHNAAIYFFDMGFVSSVGYSEQTEHYSGTEFGRLKEDKTIICGIYHSFKHLEDNVIKLCLSSAHNNYLVSPAPVCSGWPVW